MTNQGSMVDGDKFVALAADLCPALAERAARCERDRRIPEETISELREAGLLHLPLPTELGGRGTDVRTVVRVAAELGKGCASTAWVANLLNLGSWFTVNLLPSDGVSEVFTSDELPLVCGVLGLSGTATAANGGYVVEGSWGFASGSLHSNWALMGVRMLDAAGAPTGTGLAWMPIADLTIKDTWYVAGMCGTGSNTLVVDKVLVPHHRMFACPDDLAKTFQHSPVAPAFSVVLLGPLLGAAESILQSVVSNLDRRGITYFQFDRKSESQVVLETVGKAAMLIDSAWLHTERALATIDAEWLTGPMDYRTSARGQADAASAAAALRRAVGLLMNVAGASGFAEGSPLQRAWRDLEVGSHHAVLNTALSHELYGRVLAGVAPNSALWGPDARVLV